MNAGRLCHYVTIEAVTRTSDSGGGATESWASISNGAIWVEITPITSSEQFAGEQLQNVITHKIWMRYLSGVTTAHRVTFGSRHFHIRSVVNVKEKDVDMLLLAEEVISR